MKVLQRLRCLISHRDVVVLWEDRSESVTGKPATYVPPRAYLQYHCNACGQDSPVRGIYEHHSPADAWETGLRDAEMREEDARRAAAAARHAQ